MICYKKCTYRDSKPGEDCEILINPPTCQLFQSTENINNASERLPINHTQWANVLSGLDKKTLVRLCNENGIEIKNAYQRDRHTMGSELAKKIDVNKRMFLEITFS
jgi:hypothetical protein